MGNHQVLKLSVLTDSCKTGKQVEKKGELPCLIAREWPINQRCAPLVTTKSLLFPRKLRIELSPPQSMRHL